MLPRTSRCGHVIAQPLRTSILEESNGFDEAILVVGSFGG
jgi:hypothetical protein